MGPRPSSNKTNQEAQSRGAQGESAVGAPLEHILAAEPWGAGSPFVGRRSGRYRPQTRVA
jgi:hypothetical protein